MSCCSTGTYNICINQNATLTTTFLWSTGGCGCATVGSSYSPVDLTGYTAVMQFRPFQDSPTIYYDASSDITLGGTAGTIALVIPASATAGFTWTQAVYDLLLTSSSGVATRLLEGTVTVSPGVSVG
jgi:hypothetical protein